MFEKPELPLRELARSEPLLERARQMTDSPGPSAPNGIKLVRVAVDNPNDTAVLDAFFYNLNYLAAIVARYTVDNRRAKSIFPISGGTRVRAGSATGQVQVDSTANPPNVAITQPDPAKPVLRLVVKPIGDYSTYTLGLRSAGISNTLIDPLFAEIRFKFRPGCFNNNCAPEWEAALPPFEEPGIDYLAKDYGSFRQTMIAAMSSRVPGWQPTSEADLDLVLCELFSVTADELSDYQDRVMNEAYFASARKRVSTARHARLMDYHIHQGSQASTWLALEIEHDTGQKSFELKPGLTVWAGPADAALLEKKPDLSAPYISKYESTQKVHQYLNNIGLYTWSDTITSLAAGSTRADLKLYRKLYLSDTAAPIRVMTKAAAEEIRDLIIAKRIRYLLIQERLNPKTGKEAGRNPAKRQLLRLIPEGAEAVNDPIANEWFVRVRWEKADALRYDYCFTVDCPADNSGTAIGQVENVSLFHGNLVEVFHGRRQTSVFKDEGDLLLIDPALPLEFHYARKPFGKPARWGAIGRLPEVPLAYKQTMRGGDIPPVSTLEVAVETSGGGKDVWQEVPNFVHSDDSSENGDHFVVETDENRRSIIRFGNGTNGRELPDGAKVTCTYQYGMPLDGNVGAGKIVHFDPATVSGDPMMPAINLRACWNPFDVTNGADREPVAEIIRRVPEAYRQRQLRAVTLADYVARAEEIDGVARAAARYAWTGSWRTVRVTIDPVGTNELSYELRKTVADYLSAVRLIGEDLEIRPPIFIPLEINVVLCAEPDVWPEDIRFVLEQEFSAGWTPDGRKGFFHPDEWTFGQALYASQIIGRAIKVKGVAHFVGQKAIFGGVEKTISVSIKRWNSPSAAADSLAQLDYNEIIQVMNDPDHMEQGSIRFTVKGGRP
jgi:hypothetical protein